MDAKLRIEGYDVFDVYLLHIRKKRELETLFNKEIKIGKYYLLMGEFAKLNARK